MASTWRIPLSHVVIERQLNSFLVESKFYRRFIDALMYKVEAVYNGHPRDLFIKDGRLIKCLCIQVGL